MQKLGGCVRKGRPKLQAWDDNLALREAELRTLTKDQLQAFSCYWDEYVQISLATSPRSQIAEEMAAQERKENPDRAEAWHQQLS